MNLSWETDSEFFVLLAFGVAAFLILAMVHFDGLRELKESDRHAPKHR